MSWTKNLKLTPQIGKNPTVNTSFLPDKARDAKAQELKKQLMEE